MADTQNEPLKHLRLAVVFSSTLALIQSTIWIIFPIVQIISYASCPELSGTLVSFLQNVKMMYLRRGSCEGLTPPKEAFNSDDLLIFNCVVLALSVLWLLSSILMIGGVKEETLKRQSSLYLSVWSTITICVCIVDIIMVGFFAADIDYYANLSTSRGLTQSLVSTIMMIISFKGIGLWFLNLACAIYLSICAGLVGKLSEEVQDHNTIARGPINAFDTNIEQRSSLWLANAGTMERPRVQNQYPRQGETNFGYMDNSRYQQQQPLASIMKKSVADKHNMQKNREPGNIPSPDYSPPQVRRQQSYNNNNNNMGNSRQPETSTYYNNPLYKR